MQHNWNLPKRVFEFSLDTCRAKTKPMLDNSSLSRQLLCQNVTPFRQFLDVNVLELHLSRISCRLIKTGRNHRKCKASRNCPNGVFDVRKTQGIHKFLTSTASLEQTTCLRIVQCAFHPLRRIYILLL